MNKATFFGHNMMWKADLGAQIGTPKRPSRMWNILCGTVWDPGTSSPSLAQKRLIQALESTVASTKAIFYLDVPVKMDHSRAYVQGVIYSSLFSFPPNLCHQQVLWFCSPRSSPMCPHLSSLPPSPSPLWESPQLLPGLPAPTFPPGLFCQIARASHFKKCAADHAVLLKILPCLPCVLRIKSKLLSLAFSWKHPSHSHLHAYLPLIRWPLSSPTLSVQSYPTHPHTQHLPLPPPLFLPNSFHALRFRHPRL